ncbi:MAG: hypothetical protein AB1428_07025 [Bacteroidota bacterium]
MLAATPVSATLQDSDQAVASNLEVYQSLAAEIADSLAVPPAGEGGRNVHVAVSPSEARWFLEEPVRRRFLARGWRVHPADTAEYRADVGVLQMRVTYANVRRPGLFSARVADRTVRMVAFVRLASIKAGAVLAEGEKVASRMDTVDVALIESLENPMVAVTQGKMPAESFLSGWAEPLAVIGAVAIAIYLLFTVRS